MRSKNEHDTDVANVEKRNNESSQRNALGANRRRDRLFDQLAHRVDADGLTHGGDFVGTRPEMPLGESVQHGERLHAHQSIVKAAHVKGRNRGV